MDMALLKEKGLKIPDFEDLIYISGFVGVDPLNEAHLFWVLKLALDLTFPPPEKNNNSQVHGIGISDIERMTESIKKFCKEYPLHEIDQKYEQFRKIEATEESLKEFENKKLLMEFINKIILKKEIKNINGRTRFLLNANTYDGKGKGIPLEN